MVRVGVNGVAEGMMLAMDGTTATSDGIDMSGEHPTAENDGKVARIEGGGKVSLTKEMVEQHPDARKFLSHKETIFSDIHCTD